MIILLNGPQGVGKDTVAQLIKKHLTSTTEIKLSMPLKRAIPAMFTFSHDFMKILEECKDDPAHALFGLSYREAQIRLFKDYLEKNFGEDVLGKLAVNAIKATANRNIVISDCGVQCEIDPIISHCKPINVGLIRIRRPGYEFKDYRTWVEPVRGIAFQELNNQFDLELLDAMVVRALQKWKLINE